MTDNNDLVKISNAFGNGFVKKVDKHGEYVKDKQGDPVMVKTQLDGGDLTGLLSEHFGDRIRFNLLTFKIEIDHNSLELGIEKLFYLTLSQVGYSVSQPVAKDSLIYAAKQNSFHPIVEFLENIEKDKSIEPVDINKISSNYLGTDNKLYDLMMKTTLVGLVARVIDRGCKFDSCLTLKGEQGIGKSSFWRILAGQEWFCDTWQQTEKDLLLTIQTCWIYEISELDGMTSKKDAATIKRLFSSSSDNFRRPYDSANDFHPRPSIFVGTCNRTDFLTDSTGSRRFQIIDLKNNPINLKKLTEDRNRILKAALQAYRKGDKTYLDDVYQSESELSNLNYLQENPFMSNIVKWLENPRKGEFGELVIIKDGFTTPEIIVWSKCRDEGRLNPADCRTAANCLRLIGYELSQIREKNKVSRKWFKK